MQRIDGRTLTGSKGHKKVRQTTWLIIILIFLFISSLFSLASIHLLSDITFGWKLNSKYLIERLGMHVLCLIFCLVSFSQKLVVILPILVFLICCRQTPYVFSFQKMCLCQILSRWPESMHLKIVFLATWTEIEIMGKLGQTISFSSCSFHYWFLFG